MVLLATAMQHLCLSKVLLLVREIEYSEGSIDAPARRAKIKVRLSSFVFEALLILLQEVIDENLNYLFGIVLSADDEPSLRIMSCHAIYACMSSCSNIECMTNSYRSRMDRRSSLTQSAS